VICHIPFKSESHAEEDGIYRFSIGPTMAELWPFLWLMAKGKDFPLCFMFRGSSCQGDFFGRTEELHDLNHNFAVSNVVVELIQ